MRNQLLRRITLASATILFVIACGEVPTGTTTDVESPFLAKGGKPARPPDNSVPVTFAFRDWPTDAVKNKPLATYNGYFRENASFGTSAYKQEFCFSFPDNTGMWLPNNDCYTGYISTGAPGIRGADSIYGMAVDSLVRTTGVVYWRTQVTEGRRKVDVQWFLYFGSDCSLSEVPETRFVATHPTSDTWTLGPPDGNEPILCRDRLKDDPKEQGLFEVGPIEMPFLVTITEAN